MKHGKSNCNVGFLCVEGLNCQAINACHLSQHRGAALPHTPGAGADGPYIVSIEELNQLSVNACHPSTGPPVGGACADARHRAHDRVYHRVDHRYTVRSMHALLAPSAHLLVEPVQMVHTTYLSKSCSNSQAMHATRPCAHLVVEPVQMAQKSKLICSPLSSVAEDLVRVVTEACLKVPIPGMSYTPHAQVSNRYSCVCRLYQHAACPHSLIALIRLYAA